MRVEGMKLQNDQKKLKKKKNVSIWNIKNDFYVF